MLKYLALSILAISSIKAMELAPSNIQASHRLGDISVSLSDEGFKVNNELVQLGNMDKKLRGLKTTQLAKMLAAGSYITVNQSDNDVYSLQLKGRLKGGGAVGATIGAVVGFGGTAILGGCSMLVASWATGPVSPGVFWGLCATLGPAIIAQAKVNAIAGGIIGGTLTGPI